MSKKNKYSTIEYVKITGQSMIKYVTKSQTIQLAFYESNFHLTMVKMDKNGRYRQVYISIWDIFKWPLVAVDRWSLAQV